MAPKDLTQEKMRATLFLQQKVKLLELSADIAKSSKGSCTKNEVLETYNYLFGGIKSHPENLKSPEKRYQFNGPYCCESWALAVSPCTDNEGAAELIWRDDIDDDGKAHIGNIGSDTKLPPLRFCPWCGHCWD